jgi:hypothetical protein
MSGGGVVLLTDRLLALGRAGAQPRAGVLGLLGLHEVQERGALHEEGRGASMRVRLNESGKHLEVSRTWSVTTDHNYVLWVPTRSLAYAMWSAAAALAGAFAASPIRRWHTLTNVRVAHVSTSRPFDFVGWAGR